mmetsp:Transcript_18754/g.25857  ORF Transcript_18754/g.25857 Transcript_18754/m.25857 type:complete len:84 (+) Transcript_18754:765-1016(+)
MNREEIRILSASCENKLVCTIISTCLDDNPSITAATANHVFNKVFNLVITEDRDLLPEEIIVECDSTKLGESLDLSFSGFRLT